MDAMTVFEVRALTEGELAIGRAVFAEEVRWARVRLMQAPPALPFGAMVPLGDVIVFGRWRARRDFSVASVTEQGWFVHELAHVWQAHGGVVLAAAKLSALGRAAYRYTLKPSAPFAAYNIERQAEIARHLFLARLGVPEIGQPKLAALEALWPVKPRV